MSSANTNDEIRLDLSDLQIQILRLVAQSLTSKQIAQQLNISHHTVDAYVWSAMKKLGADSRSKAAEIVVNPPNINSGQFIYELERIENDRPVRPDELQQGASNSNELPGGGTVFERGRSGFPGLLKLPPVGGKRHDLSITQRLAAIGRIALIAAIASVALATIIAGSLHLLGR